jgi:3-deoxy-7-phosphoheptulonate synthase
MMIVIMKNQATMREKSAVIAWAEDNGCKVHLSEGSERAVIGIIGNGRPLLAEQAEVMPGVERVVPVLKPFKIASREFRPENSHFPLGTIPLVPKN